MTTPHIRTRKGAILRFLAAALVVVLLVTVGGALWVQKVSRADPESQPSIENGQRPLGVGALGRLEPGWKIYQIAPASSADGATVEALAVEEGDLVQPGTLLATLRTHAPREAMLKEAKAQVQVAQARLALVKAGTKPEDIAAQEVLWTARPDVRSSSGSWNWLAIGGCPS